MALTAIHPGEHLAEELKELGMSAAELARKLDVPANRISGISNGQRAVTGGGVQFVGKDGEILPYGLPTFNREVNAKMPQSSHEITHEITKVEHFKIFRDYIKREDDLIDHRVSWNSTIQGFLFAAYGLSLQKPLDVKPSSGDPHNLGILVRFIPWFGIALSGLVLIAVLGAVLAHMRLRKDWHKVNPCYPLKPYLPDIAAGGSNAARRLGLVAPLAIPILFVVAWLWLLLWRSYQ
jgi:transcriptional regulator with XRE-family HTH domain